MISIRMNRNALTFRVFFYRFLFRRRFSRFENFTTPATIDLDSSSVMNNLSTKSFRELISAVFFGLRTNADVSMRRCRKARNNEALRNEIHRLPADFFGRIFVRRRKAGRAPSFCISNLLRFSQIK